MKFPNMDANPYSNKPWLALYPPDQPAILKPQFTDMLSAFRSAVHRASGTPAMHCFDSTLTYGQVDVQSDSVAVWMAKHGVRRGSRVAIALQGIPQFVIVTVACWKRGAIPVPINPMYLADELARLFSDCLPQIVCCQSENYLLTRTALEKAGISGAPVLTVTPRDNQSPDEVEALPPRDPAPPGAVDLPSALLSEDRQKPEPIELSPSDLALLLYTSGTTGKPKGAMIEHRALAFNAEAMGKWSRVGGESRILGIAPLFHVTGFVAHLALSIIQAATLILNYRFEPRLVLDTIRKRRPTYTVGAITAFNALSSLSEARPEDFASFDLVLSGGSPIPPSLREKIRVRLGLIIYPVYGMTETTSATHAALPGMDVPVDPASGALSIGVPTHSTEAMIADNDGQPVPIGEAGEILVRGPQIMAGYWNKPEETAEALSDGWMRTGDIGFMDRAGWFYLIDRKKDMINASGFKVWPREVEDVLYEHPEVREAAVIGVPDDYRGETVKAFVSLKGGASPTSADLIRFCRGKLAGYKCPRVIEILPELPKTVTGKIQRGVLRQAAPHDAANER